MNKLQLELEKKYPIPGTNVLEDLKALRLRASFECGVYWALSQFMDLIPKEDASGRQGCTYGDTKFDSLSVV
jgi:hypothetical protein